MGKKNQTRRYREIKVPKPSAAVCHIIRMAGSNSCSASELARALGRNSSLAKAVFAMARSPLHAGPADLSSLLHAVIKHGPETIRNFAVVAEIYDAFAKFQTESYLGYNRSEIFRHLIATAVICRELAAFTGYPRSEDAFLAGLLHDIGKILLESSYPHAWRKALKLANNRQVPIMLAEIEVFGRHHGVIGGKFVGLWELPDAIATAVQAHHHPSEATRAGRLVALVHVADRLARARALGHAGDSLIPPADSSSQLEMEFDDQQLHVFDRRVDQALAAAQVHFALAGAGEEQA